MFCNKHITAIVFLGLFSVMPIQGMSYIKSFFDKTQESDIEREIRIHKEQATAFIVALKKNNFFDANIIFMNATEKTQLLCLEKLLSDNYLLRTQGSKWLYRNFSNYGRLTECLKNNDMVAIELFSKMIIIEEVPLSIEIFSTASEKARKNCIKIILTNCKTLYNSPMGKWAVDHILSHEATHRYFLNNEQECRQLFSAYGLDTIFIIKFFGTSITCKHMRNNWATAEFIARQFHSLGNLSPMLKTVLAKEQEFADGYYTFIHGQRRMYYFPERLYTFLWQLRKKQHVQDFFFAHVADLVESQDDATREEAQKDLLLKTGRHDEASRKLLLFMNYALFANSTHEGSCSAAYVNLNMNSALGSFQLPADEPFKKLGFEHIYNKFKKEIDDLNRDYEYGPFGNLLFIAIPKNTVHNYAYLAASGGKRVGIQIDGIGETSDIRIIMDTLVNHPEKIKNTDKLEFCLIMTQKDGGLDPDTGIKIIPILSGRPEELVALKKREDTLLSKIKAAIEQEEKAKVSAAALQRASAIVNLVVPAKSMAKL